MRIDSVYFFPEFMLKNKDVDEVLKVCQKDIDRFFNYLENLRNQMTISEASLYLERYERMFGIVVNNSLSNDERIKRLLVKFNTRTNATVYTIKKLVETITDCSVKVIEKYDDYEFDIEITRNRETFVNTTEVEKSINIIKPSHMSYKMHLADNEDVVNKFAVAIVHSRMICFKEVEKDVI